MLPAHLPPSPAGLQQGAGTATHSRSPPHHPRPAAGSRSGCKASSLPHGGADPGRWGPRDYLHGDGRHAAPGTCRAPAALPPRSLPPPGCCRRLPSWNLSSGAERGGSWAGGRAGREAAFKAEQLTPGRARPAPLHSAARFSLSQRGSWEEPPGQGGG